MAQHDAAHLPAQYPHAARSWCIR